MMELVPRSELALRGSPRTSDVLKLNAAQSFRRAGRSLRMALSKWFRR